MNSLPSMILIAGLVVSVFIIGFGAYVLYIGRKSVFHGSGVPGEISQILLSSVHITSQNLLGIFVVTILGLLMTQRIITPEAGLPLLSAIIGYLLGKSFKDISYVSKDRNGRQ